MGEQQILIQFRLFKCLSLFTKSFLGQMERFPSGGHVRQISAGISVEQRAVSTGIDQPAIIMLAMELNQNPAQFPQQSHPDRLIIDPRL